MSEERIRNLESAGTMTKEQRIAHEEAICWAEYEASKKAEEEENRKQYEADLAAYFGEDEQSDAEVVTKNRTARHSRRRSTGQKNKKLKKDAEVASKSLRKRKKDANASAESHGKPVSAIQRCNNLISQAEKRKLI